MSRLPIMLSIVLLASHAMAQQYPAAPLGPQGEQSRSLSIRNLSGQPITSAEAKTTDGQTRPLTEGTIQSSQAREIVVPRNACLASVTVRLQDGRELKAPDMNDCRSNQLIVRDKGIDVMSSDVQRAETGSGHAATR